MATMLVFQTSDPELISVLGHCLKPSFWPISSSLSALSLLSSFVLFFKFGCLESVFVSGFLLVLSASSWWKEISYEGQSGDYTPLIVDGLKGGMILFILSEVCFFASFFWSFFHYSLNPDIAVGLSWPPISLNVFSPFQIPLLNTLILLGSGVTITSSHHQLQEGEQFLPMLKYTLFLGIYFSLLQGFEYTSASFTMSDSVYGSIFYMATGFHGTHVLVGSLFLLVCLIRGHKTNSLTGLGFVMAAWYWHFVDVVWIFLFSFMYWWSCLW